MRVGIGASVRPGQVEAEERARRRAAAAAERAAALPAAVDPAREARLGRRPVREPGGVVVVELLEEDDADEEDDARREAERLGDRPRARLGPRLVQVAPGEARRERAALDDAAQRAAVGAAVSEERYKVEWEAAERSGAVLNQRRRRRRAHGMSAFVAA